MNTNYTQFTYLKVCWRHNDETSHGMSFLHYNVGYMLYFISTITTVILDRFWYFLYHWKEYSTKQIQNVSLQPNYVSTLSGKTNNNTKTAEGLLQCVLLNLMF